MAKGSKIEEIRDLLKKAKYVKSFENDYGETLTFEHYRFSEEEMEEFIEALENRIIDKLFESVNFFEE